MVNEKKAYTLLIIAPFGAHLRNFLSRVEHNTSEIHIITSKPLDFVTKWKHTIVDFSLKKVSNYWRTVRSIREVTREFNPDVVHIHQLNSVAFFSILAIKRLNIPIVSTAWGSDVLLLPKQSFLMKLMVKYCIKSSDAISSDSNHMADEIRTLMNPSVPDIVVCNFGVSAPLFDLEKENIIYSNRLHKPLYRVDLIIRAFSNFVNTPEGKTWTLVIGATGSETESLKLLSENLNLQGKVKFVGWLEREDNMRWYARSKVWVSIPKSDATAISLLEAMYNGCYPVVVDLPASHEWIKSKAQGRIVKEGEVNFFEGLSKADMEMASSINVKLIEKEATYEISEARFLELHERAMKRNG
ncbi:MAG: glycosyltransferase family 4 protein [Bacteroidota bacterium]